MQVLCPKCSHVCYKQSGAKGEETWGCRNCYHHFELNGEQPAEVAAGNDLINAHIEGDEVTDELWVEFEGEIDEDEWGWVDGV